MIFVLEKEEDLKKFLEEKDKLLVLYFTASWCGPCKKIFKFIEKIQKVDEISEKFNLLKIDVDTFQDITEEYNVECMPTFYFYKNEKKDTMTGANEELFSEYVKKYIN